MSIAASYSPCDLLHFTHVLDQIAAETGGLDEATRARTGVCIAMAAASRILAVPDLVAFARAGI